MNNFMKIQKINMYPRSTPQFKSYDDSYNYDWGTESSKITFSDAITTSAIVSGIIFLAGFIVDKGYQTIEKFSKNKKSLHINKLI
jgi:hypothetical protein